MTGLAAPYVLDGACRQPLIVIWHIHMCHAMNQNSSGWHLFDRGYSMYWPIVFSCHVETVQVSSFILAILTAD